MFDWNGSNVNIVQWIDKLIIERNWKGNRMQLRISSLDAFRDNTISWFSTEWLTWLSAFAYSAAPLAPPECFPSNRKWWENCTERWADCRTARRCSDCKKTAELSNAYHRSDCSSPKSLCRYESALAPSWCELNFRTSTSHNSLTRTANSENVHYQSITKCLTSGTCKGKSTFDRSAINFFTLINHKLARTSKHFLGPQLSHCTRTIRRRIFFTRVKSGISHRHSRPSERLNSE